jgi:hypothetical protein
MLVPLDRHARLAAHPNHKKACFYIDLDELKGDTLLIRHKWEITLGTMKRRWRPAGDGIVQSDSLCDVSDGDC